MTTRKIVAEAADRPGMTVDELTDLVDRARAAGASGAEVVEVQTRGIGTVRIKTAKIAISETADRA